MENSQFLEGIGAELEIQFDTPGEAAIVLGSIEPEINESPSDRTSISLNLSGSTVKITIHSKDAPSFRAAMNSYLRWIKLSNEVISIRNKY